MGAKAPKVRVIPQRLVKGTEVRHQEELPSHVENEKQRAVKLGDSHPEFPLFCSVQKTESHRGEGVSLIREPVTTRTQNLETPYSVGAGGSGSSLSTLAYDTSDLCPVSLNTA